MARQYESAGELEGGGPNLGSDQFIDDPPPSGLPKDGTSSTKASAALTAPASTSTTLATILATETTRRVRHPNPTGNHRFHRVRKE